jgi:hypothetical protein
MPAAGSEQAAFISGNLSVTGTKNQRGDKRLLDRPDHYKS